MSKPTPSLRKFLVDPPRIQVEEILADDGCVIILHEAIGRLNLEAVVRIWTRLQDDPGIYDAAHARKQQGGRK